MSKKIKWILLSVGVLFVGYICYFAIATYTGFKDFNKAGAADSPFAAFEKKDQNDPKLVPPEWEGKERVNILVLGGDSRGLDKNEVPRSDSMVVISINPATKKAIMFSIMRDTYVRIMGHGSTKINAALAYGGPDLAMNAVGTLMGIPIQYYVYTDFKGFIGVIDAIGGLDFNVEKDMKYSDSEDHHLYDIDLKKGMQHLDGKTALEYVRFRHDALSDFARSERQRNFLQALAAKLQTPMSFLKLPTILHEIDPYINTNMTVSEMAKLGFLSYEAKASGIVGQQIPPDNLLTETTIGGASVVTTNLVKLKQFVQTRLLQADQPATSSASPSPSPSPKKITK